MNPRTSLSLFGASLLAVSALRAQNDWSSLANDGKLLLDARLRYEDAEAEPTAASRALTLRTRLGWQSGEVDGFSFLVEGEDIRLLSDSAKANLAGQTTTDVPRTAIADPEETELNRLWVQWKNEQGTFKIGRQRIIHDNARFIGNVGWRQNEQTFDAVRLNLATPDAPWTLEYTYIDKVQRIFGDGAPGGSDFDADTHLARGTYAVNDALSLVGFAYLQRLHTKTGAAFAGSNDTYGLRVSGSWAIDESWKLSYTGTYAWQTDNGANPAGSDFKLSYLAISGELSRGAGAVGLGWERLEGNGTRMFTTPLATVHAFNGWADVFLGSSIGGGLGGGLDDVYLDARYKLPVGKGLTVRGIHHWFSPESGGDDYGTELDLLAVYPLTKQLKATVKYADFSADRAGMGDKTVLWLQVDLAY